MAGGRLDWKARLVDLGIVAALMSLGFLVAVGAHFLLWGGRSDHEMLSLVLGVGAALPALLYLIVSGRDFSLRGKGFSLDVGGSIDEAAQRVLPKTEVIAVPSSDLADRLAALPPGFDPLVTVRIGTPADAIKNAIDTMDRTGHPPAVVVIVDTDGRGLGQVDARSFRNALHGADKEAQDFLAALTSANTRGLRRNWFVSDVLSPDTPKRASLGHMVREQLDVMVINDDDGRPTKMVDRRALIDHLVHSEAIA